MFENDVFKVGDKVKFLFDPIEEGSFFIKSVVTVGNDKHPSTLYNLSKTEQSKIIHFGVNGKSMILDSIYYRKLKLEKICSRLEI